MRKIFGTEWGRLLALTPAFLAWLASQVAGALWVIQWALFLVMAMMIFASMLVTANMERAEVTSHE